MSCKARWAQHSRCTLYVFQGFSVSRIGCPQPKPCVIVSRRISALQGTDRLLADGVRIGVLPHLERHAEVTPVVQLVAAEVAAVRTVADAWGRVNLRGGGRRCTLWHTLEYGAGPAGHVHPSCALQARHRPLLPSCAQCHAHKTTRTACASLASGCCPRLRGVELLLQPSERVRSHLDANKHHTSKRQAGVCALVAASVYACFCR